MKLGASGRLELAAGEPTPFAIVLDVTPLQNGDELRFEALSLDLRTSPEAAPWMRLEGVVALPTSDALRLDMLATLPDWPADWPERY